MEKKKYFKETVHMPGRKGWVAAMFLIPVFIAFGIFKQLYTSESLGFSLAVVGTIMAVMGLIAYVIYNLELKTKVTADGIEVRMRPFFPRKRLITWAEMESCTMVTTPPLALKQGENMAFLMERCFTLNGMNGVSIATKDGEHIFIGSLRPAKLKKAIEAAWVD